MRLHLSPRPKTPIVSGDTGPHLVDIVFVAGEFYSSATYVKLCGALTPGSTNNTPSRSP